MLLFNPKTIQVFATCQKILMALADQFLQLFMTDDMLTFEADDKFVSTEGES